MRSDPTAVTPVNTPLAIWSPRSCRVELSWPSTLSSCSSRMFSGGPRSQSWTSTIASEA